VFEKMLGRGNPPDDWAALVAASKADWLGQHKG
jgi:toxin YhaV